MTADGRRGPSRSSRTSPTRSSRGFTVGSFESIEVDEAWARAVREGRCSRATVVYGPCATCPRSTFFAPRLPDQAPPTYRRSGLPTTSALWILEPMGRGLAQRHATRAPSRGDVAELERVVSGGGERGAPFLKRRPQILAAGSRGRIEGDQPDPRAPSTCSGRSPGRVLLMPQVFVWVAQRRQRAAASSPTRSFRPEASGPGNVRSIAQFFWPNWRHATLRAGEPVDSRGVPGSRGTAAPATTCSLRRLTYTLLRRPGARAGARYRGPDAQAPPTGCAKDVIRQPEAAEDHRRHGRRRLPPSARS